MLLAAVPAMSQAANPNAHSSQADVTIRVRLPNEQPPPYPVQVELVTLDGIPISQSFTHGDGRADLRDVPEGSYRVKISGAEYVTFMSEPFTILHNERLHTETFRIALRPDAAQKAGKMISASELQVPAKAREQLDKAEKQFETGAADDAMESLRKAIEIYPQYARAYNNLGVVLISKGDSNGAIEAFQKSLKADDKFVPGMINLARLELRGRELDKAQTYSEQALTIEPLNLEALSLLANVQFYQAKYADAAATVSRIHAMPHEGFADAHLVAAEAYQKTGQNQEALAQCRLFLKENPKSPRAEQVRSAMKVLEARK
jgi:Tfp pilus assembly protein PilF